MTLPSIDRDPRVLQPSRVIVGNCPRCSAPVVVTNEFETWPWISCRCGAGFDTTQIANRIRYERGSIDVGPDLYRGAELHMEQHALDVARHARLEVMEAAQEVLPPHEVSVLAARVAEKLL